MDFTAVVVLFLFLRVGFVIMNNIFVPNLAAQQIHLMRCGMLCRFYNAVGLGEGRLYKLINALVNLRNRQIYIC